MNKLEVAENYFLKAKEILPNNDLVSITLGLLLTKLEKHEVAEKIFENLDIEYWEFISLSQPHYLSSQYVFRN
ncbi:MAG: hypothetical protein IPM81_02115 [Saprospirales bacterium]|nr:hypothetical protein [Saprospirales bacterium]